MRQLQLLDNTFFVETPAGIPSLQLANDLAAQDGVVASVPNWGSEVELLQTSDDNHGDDIDSATEIALNTRVSGAIYESDDIDIFRFQLDETTLIAAGDFQDGEFFSQTNCLRYEILDENGDILDPPGPGCLAYAVLEPGTWYVLVGAWFDGSMPTKRYHIEVKTIPDHGDSMETATAIALKLGLVEFDDLGFWPDHRAAIGDLRSTDDLDFFKFTLDRSTEVIIGPSTWWVSVISWWDIAASVNLDVLDSHGNPVEPPIKDGVSLRGRSYSLEAGTYYLRFSPTEFPVPYPLAYAFDFTVNTVYEEFVSGCADIQEEYDDPLWGCQWHLENDADNRGQPGQDINIGDAWDITKGEGVNVAVLDDMIESDHEDLKDNWNTELSWDYLADGDTADPRLYYHGTAVAGIIAARDNGTGGRGVAPQAGIVGRAIFNNYTLEQIIDGFTRDAPSIAISNNSWGPIYESHDTVSQLWDDALEAGIKNGFDGKGTLYVRSAGNGYTIGRHPNESEAKSSYAQVLACAVDADGNREYYSETGYVLWVCAPSDVVTTDSRNRYFEDFRGTSASAPIVSGVAALLRGANPDLPWRDLKLILAASARKNDPKTGWERGALEYGSETERYHYNPAYGFGVVDASAALKLALDWPGLPPFLNASGDSEQVSRLIPEEGSNPRTKASEIPISSYITFTEFVEVHVDLDHPGFRELKITLESPAGTTSVLTPGEGWQEADGPISVKLRMGSARHLGEDPNGIWTLRFSDHKDGGQGSLKGWSIKVYGHDGVCGVDQATNEASLPRGTVWSGTLTAGRSSDQGGYGYDSIWTGGGGSLCPTSFEMGGVFYRVKYAEAAHTVHFTTGEVLPPGLTLYIDDESLALNDATLGSYDYGHVYTGPSTGVVWNSGDTVELRLEVPPNTPATGKPIIKGTPKVGVLLTVKKSGIVDADGLSNPPYTYQWLAEDADITGATRASYTPVVADEGKTIKVRVSFTDDLDYRETLTSDATTAVAATPNRPACRRSRAQPGWEESSSWTSRTSRTPTA